MLAQARAAGAIVTCDLISPRRSAIEEIGRILPHVDYFMPSAAEAVFLTGLEDLGAAAARFVALGARACVIKNGRAGVVALIDGQLHTVPAFAVEPVDTRELRVTPSAPGSSPRSTAAGRRWTRAGSQAWWRGWWPRASERSGRYRGSTPRWRRNRTLRRGYVRSLAPQPA